MAQNWCITKSKFLEFGTTWTIQNAHFHLNARKQLESSDFSSGFFDSNKWCLGIQPNGEYLSVYLKVKNRTCSTVLAEFSVSILSSSGTKLLTEKSSVKVFDIRTGNPPMAEKELKKFIKFQTLLTQAEMTPNGNLTLLCEITKHVTVANDSGRGQRKGIVKLRFPEDTLQQQMGLLLNDDKFADFILVVGGQEVRAHKNILAVRSPVFAAMFDSTMEENTKNRIVIEDLEYEVVQEMLRYMYTGKAPHLDRMADRLLIAADKYSLETLKVMCEQALCDTLSVNTAVEVLALAYMFNAKQLKDHTTAFINANILDVMTTPAWKDMIQERSVRLYPRPKRLPLWLVVREVRKALANIVVFAQELFHY